MAEKRIVTPEAVLSFPALFKRSKPMQDQDEGKFQCELIFAAGADLSKLESAIKQAKEDKWGSKPPNNLRMPIRNGSDRDKEGYEGEGVKFISPRTNDKPGVVIGPNRDPCLEPSEVYGGCVVRASVTAFAYDLPTSKGISFALNNVWKLRDGKPFSGRKTAEQDFVDTDVDKSAFGVEESSSLL